MRQLHQGLTALLALLAFSGAAAGVTFSWLYAVEPSDQLTRLLWAGFLTGFFSAMGCLLCCAEGNPFKGGGR